MNSLLKRQIRKYLSQEMESSKELLEFLDAVDRSYHNFDEQYVMQQRAMSISSDELFIANEQLQHEAAAQLKVINKLKRVIETLKFYQLPQGDTIENLDLDGLKLVEFIDNQTKKIVEMNKQREKLLGELEHQNKELSDYAHMVSHDLKSPLRSIDALTLWLQQDYQDKFDKGANDSIGLIRNNVEKMDRLITGILDYSTISKDQAEVYEVNLNNLIDDIIQMMLVPSHISIVKKSDLPIVIGNKFRLQQLFQNLIDNAVQYNDKERGVIEISMVEEKDYWEFSIKDNGKGIDQTYFDKIFETFQKLENNSKSSGIGLAVVKKIVNLYGGRIWLESKINYGTTFYFTLKK